MRDGERDDMAAVVLFYSNKHLGLIFWSVESCEHVHVRICTHDEVFINATTVSSWSLESDFLFLINKLLLQWLEAKVSSYCRHQYYTKDE